MSTNTIITIERQYGSGGHLIGEKLAESLGIPFYDSELIKVAAKESGICEEIFESFDEKPTTSFLYSLVMDPYSLGYNSNSFDLPLNHKVFLAAFDTIKELASKGPCVFVGRCADYVLGDYSNVINTFIYAYKDDRLNRIMDIYKLTEKQAADKIKKTDRERKLYYEARTGREWGGIESNSMLFNTSLLGIDGVTDALEAIYRKWESRG